MSKLSDRVYHEMRTTNDQWLGVALEQSLGALSFFQKIIDELVEEKLKETIDDRVEEIVESLLDYKVEEIVDCKLDDQLETMVRDIIEEGDK